MRRWLLLVGTLGVRIQPSDCLWRAVTLARWSRPHRIPAHGEPPRRLQRRLPAAAPLHFATEDWTPRNEWIDGARTRVADLMEPIREENFVRPSTTPMTTAIVRLITSDAMRCISRLRQAYHLQGRLDGLHYEATSYMRSRQLLLQWAFSRWVSARLGPDLGPHVHLSSPTLGAALAPIQPWQFCREAIVVAPMRMVKAGLSLLRLWLSNKWPSKQSRRRNQRLLGTSTCWLISRTAPRVSSNASRRSPTMSLRSPALPWSGDTTPF